MSIYDTDLFGRTKHQLAIDRIRNFVTERRTACVAFSGGKDSQCCYHLCEEAGVPFTARYSITRFEPPELMRFVRKHYPSVMFKRAYAKSLVEEIKEKGLPSRWARWCCDSKHTTTPAERDAYVYIIGIRAEESARRAQTWRIFGNKQDGSAYVCPIIDWTENDVWEYLDARPHCQLYDEGHKRIGCVMCPLAHNNMKRDAARWPKTAAMLRIGSDAFVARMRKQNFITGHGRPCPDWCDSESPEDEYWRRWYLTGQTAKPVGDAPVADEMCLFSGSGFSENDNNSFAD